MYYDEWLVGERLSAIFVVLLQCYVFLLISPAIRTVRVLSAQHGRSVAAWLFPGLLGGTNLLKPTQTCYSVDYGRDRAFSPYGGNIWGL